MTQTLALPVGSRKPGTPSLLGGAGWGVSHCARGSVEWSGGLCLVEGFSQRWRPESNVGGGDAGVVLPGG